MSGGLEKARRNPRSQASRSSGVPGSVIATNCEPLPAGALPEIAEEAVALLGRARLARDDEQGLRQVAALLGLAHGAGIGAVEHVERGIARRGAERAPQHLGRQARAAHAAEHHPAELRPHLVGEGGEGLRLLRHRLADGEPAQPVPDLRRVGVVLPDRRVAGPDALGQLGASSMASSRTATAASTCRTTAEWLGGAWPRAPCACSRSRRAAPRTTWRTSRSRRPPARG